MVNRPQHQRLPPGGAAWPLTACVCRELEGLIFQCGLDLEELKETVEVLHSPSPHLTPVPHPSDGGDAPPSLSKVPVSISALIFILWWLFRLPQSPAVRLSVDHKGGKVHVHDTLCCFLRVIVYLMPD